MPTTLEQISWFYFALGLVLIPITTGFFLEAGKDFYNLFRKKPSPEALQETFNARCRETNERCKKAVDDDVANLKAKDRELDAVAKQLEKNQADLRQGRLQAMEISLTKLTVNSDNLDKKMDGINENIQKLFDLWNGLHIQGKNTGA
jgi:hypothetical protein